MQRGSRRPPPTGVGTRWQSQRSHPFARRSSLDSHGRCEPAEDPGRKPGGECQRIRQHRFSATGVSPWESILRNALKHLHGTLWPSHFPQPAVMLGQPGPESAVGGIFHAEFPARLLDDLRHSRIVYVTDRREKMVLQVKVEASEEPRPDPVTPVVIERDLGLEGTPGPPRRIILPPRRRISISSFVLFRRSSSTSDSRFLL